MIAKLVIAGKLVDVIVDTTRKRRKRDRVRCPVNQLKRMKEMKGEKKR